MSLSDRKRPRLALDYAATDVWLQPREPLPGNRALLRNIGSAGALQITISDLIVGRDERCRFAGIHEMAAGSSLSLEHVWCDHISEGEIHARPARLTEVLSKAVVRAALAGRRPRRHWTLWIDYTDAGGARYVNLCEIRLRQLPLELEVVRLAEVEASSVPNAPARAREPRGFSEGSPGADAGRTMGLAATR